MISWRRRQTEFKIVVFQQNNRTTFLPVALGHEEVLGVRRHVEPQRERKVRVYFFLHHGHHVERVAHGVKAQDPRELLKTCPERQKEIVVKYSGVLTERLQLSQEKGNCTVSQRVLSSHTESRCTCYHPPECPWWSPHPETPETVTDDVCIRIRGWYCLIVVAVSVTDNRGNIKDQKWFYLCDVSLSLAYYWNSQ